MMKNIVVLISGRGSNLNSIILSTKKKNFPAKVSLVISDNKEALGLEIAKNNNIKNTVIDHKAFNDKGSFEEALIRTIVQHTPDLICLAGFMRILSKNFIEKFDGKIINIHPSLLPKYKGLNTHERAIKSGDLHSGCTVHYVTDDLDGGKIIAQEQVLIEVGDDALSLSKKILKIEHKIYPKSIKSILK